MTMTPVLGPEQPQDVPLNVLHDAPAGSDQEANHTPEPPAELLPSDVLNV